MTCGRYVEINMLPLSLSEYLDFCGLSFDEGSSVALASDGSPVLFDDVDGIKIVQARDFFLNA